MGTHPIFESDFDCLTENMTNDELDAQLAELQAQLKSVVGKSTTDFDWPQAPDLDELNSIPPIDEPAERSPSVKELTQVAESNEQKKVTFASKNPEAEKEVDDLTERLMTSLESGSKIEAGENDSGIIGQCYKCKKDICGYENACSAMGHYFHIECLCCLKCGKNLHGGEFIVMGTDDPYCHDCYESSLEKCCECGEVIKTRILRAAGKTYHPECFKCVNCKCCLDGVPFTQDSDNRPFCISCYHELHSPKCERCQKPIAPQPGQKEAMRIIAMDKSFCKPCFTCIKCSLNLSETKAGGCYPVNKEFYCKQCSISAINETVMAN